MWRTKRFENSPRVRDFLYYKNLEPSPFTPLLSLTADWGQKWQSKTLISPETNPLRTHFVSRLYEWVHIDEVTASASTNCHHEYELTKEKLVSPWVESLKPRDPNLFAKSKLRTANCEPIFVSGRK
jgi:hypothetical protein